MKTLAEVSGVVARPAAEVFEEVRRRVTGSGHPMRTEVDRDRGFLAVQGGWWYRGEYRVTADPAGARVEHRVVNAASRGRWGVPLATASSSDSGRARLSLSPGCWRNWSGRMASRRLRRVG